MLLMLVAAITSGCKFKTQAQPLAKVEAVKAAVLALNQQWERAFKARDATALAALYATDRLPDGGAVVTGRQAIAAQYRQEFKALWEPDSNAAIVIVTEEIVVAGELSAPLQPLAWRFASSSPRKSSSRASTLSPEAATLSAVNALGSRVALPPARARLSASQ